MSSFDIVCIGNSLIDIFLTIHDENKHMSLNNETHEITIMSGDKINVDNYQFQLGGSGSNVAVGLSRLGLSVGMLSDIGSDEFSEKILKSFKQEKVETTTIAKHEDMQTSFSFILNYKKERTIFVEHVPYEHQFDLQPIKTAWIYLASLGQKWGSVYEKVLENIEKTQTSLALNPGSLEIDSQGNLLFKAIAKSSILFLNKEEANQLVEHSDRDVLDLLREIKKLGARIVVITDGPKGSYLMDEKGNSYYLNCFPANTVDPTGAGDAYSTGFVYAIISGKTIQEAMEIGAANAVYVVESVGAQPGLMKREELTEKTQKFEHFSPEVYNG